MLRRRLSIALRVDLSNVKDEATGNLLSKLGNAKYHLFSPGVKFSKRKQVRRRDFLKGEARVAERIEAQVKDFLDEDLGWHVDSQVERWLDNISVVETESLCSDAAADVWRWADLPEERAPADAVLRRQCIDASEEREAQQKAAGSEPEEEC